MSAKGSLSAQKRNRQNEKRRLRNKTFTTKIKHSAKKILGLIEEKNKERAKAEFLGFTSHVDKAVKKGIFHKNTAARKKSHMQKKINALA